MSFSRALVARVLAACVTVCACVALPRGGGSSEWRPSDVHPAHVALATVLEAVATAAGPPEPRFASRRERWTYVNGGHRLTASVAVKNANYRVSIPVGNAVYEAGRLSGVPWRGDANGIVHATYSEDQGDALDRVPRALFPLERGDLSLAGETAGASPLWVIADRPARDKPRWLFVDRSGEIVREVVRDGARTVVTSFDGFERAAGTTRPRHWRVSDGNRDNELDAELESVVPGTVDDNAVAIPEAQRVFAAVDGTEKPVVTLPSHFVGRTIVVDVSIGGRKAAMILDTGTASITLDAATARNYGWPVVLEHASVPVLTIGGIGLSNASVLAIPFNVPQYHHAIGILGLDFFFGHVVHIDYEHERVEILDRKAAAPVFSDPKNTVIHADVGEGLPLVHAAFGAASGDRFAIDTGSSRLHVLEPFVRRWSAEIAAHWSPAAFRSGRSAMYEDYLEGSIRVGARRVSDFRFGAARFGDLVVGVEETNGNSDAISIPLDGIIGTDQLCRFDLWFDYDEDRIALRRNHL